MEMASLQGIGARMSFGSPYFLYLITRVSFYFTSPDLSVNLICIYKDKLLRCKL